MQEKVNRLLKEENKGANTPQEEDHNNDENIPLRREKSEPAKQPHSLEKIQTDFNSKDIKEGK